jgi:DNA-binding NarL/FixJ family response regulator
MLEPGSARIQASVDQTAEPTGRVTPRVGADCDEPLFTPAEWRRIGQELDLSGRELTIATLLIEGCTRDAIAYRLRKADGRCLSPDTIRVYVDRLYEKARVRDKMGLVRRIVRIYLRIERYR